MDPVTHTFVGASLSAAGLRRATPLATATLVLAANAPDVDLVAQLWGPYTALEWRRGITHGIPALLVLPCLVAGAVLAWDRRIRRRRRPDAPAARPGAVLGLAVLGVWTHPALDWLNTYGMRWLAPLDGRWSYGDALFILDPWVWLLLGGALFLIHSGGRSPRALWALLAAALSLPVLGAAGVPLWTKVLWAAGIGGWVLLRWRNGPDPPPARGERAVRLAVGAAAVYVLVMVIQTPLSERIVRAEARALGLPPVEDVMVGPAPGDAFRGQVILRHRGGYERGRFSWLESPRLHLEPGTLESAPRDRIVEAAATLPEARSFLVWSRFPLYRVTEAEDGWLVRIRDVRFLRAEGAGRLAGLDVHVGEALRPRLEESGVPPDIPVRPSRRAHLRPGATTMTRHALRAAAAAALLLAPTLPAPAGAQEPSASIRTLMEGSADPARP